MTFLIFASTSLAKPMRSIRYLLKIDSASILKTMAIIEKLRSRCGHIPI